MFANPAELSHDNGGADRYRSTGCWSWRNWFARNQGSLKAPSSKQTRSRGGVVLFGQAVQAFSCCQMESGYSRESAEYVLPRKQESAQRSR